VTTRSLAPSLSFSSAFTSIIFHKRIACVTLKGKFVVQYQEKGGGNKSTKS
jgi:hypothetical protein